MKRTGKSRLVLALAASAALAAWSSASRAQVASGNDGHAMDANTRVGSGGLNQPIGQGGGVSPNQIIYGNVTGGKRFTGPLGERDPYAFSGPTAGRLADRFIAGSAGAPQPYQPPVDLSNPQPFFGSSRAAPPPVGSYRDGFTGAYLGSNLAPQSDFGTNEYTAALNYREQPLGRSTILGTRSTLVGTQPGETLLQGPGQDATNLGLSGSPLYGVQPLRQGAEGATPTGPLAGPGDRFRIDSAEMRRMRSELLSPNGQLPEDAQQNNGQQRSGQQQQGFQRSFDAPDTGGMNDRSNTGTGAGGFSNDLQTSQATQRRFTIVAPELQSEQYREMKRRLGQYENPQYAQMEAQHRARLERQVYQAKSARPATRPAGGAGGAQAGLEGGAVIPGSALRQPGQANINLQPMKVTSLATGVRAKGLHDLLASAEDFMRQGKFQSAVDRYNLAFELAPNNPLVPLGRANAELGAGAFRLANGDLHNVFTADRAILLAQYDLKAWFPAERLAAVRQQLHDLSLKDANDEMPEFLLAYVAYNTGDADQAMRHLAEARKRAGNQDPALGLLQSLWKLPQQMSPDVPPTQLPPADLNK